MELNLKQIFRLARRWWWLFIVTAAVAGGMAYYASDQQEPLYRASTVVQVNPPQTSSAVDFYALAGSKTLAGTYLQLITTRNVLEPLVTDLQLPYDVEELQSKVTAGIVGDTQLIRISVSDPDPETAATLANAVAERFVNYTIERAQELSGPYRETINQAIAQVDVQIQETQDRINQLQQQQATTEQQDQINDLRSDLADLQQQRTSLLLDLNDMDLNAAGAQSRVTVEEAAIPPDSPYAPRTTLYTILAVFVGLILAAGGVALIEYLDNTVKAGLDFTEMVGAPQLSAIDTVSRLGAGVDQLFVLNQPQSRPAEEIRLLRTNIEFAAAAREITTLAVTSAGPGEGKSTITANLAIAMAQAGFSTAIVDADLRRPSQHRIFSISNDRGLTTLLLRHDRSWRWASSSVPGLSLLIIPSGPLPPNPGDLLNLGRFGELIKQLTEEVDVVLVDTPPVLAVSDPLIVSSLVDGVLLVCQSGRTRIEALRHMVAALPQPSSRLLGIVVNRQRGSRGSGYYYDYYTPNEKPQGGSAVPAPEPRGRAAEAPVRRSEA